MQLLLFPTSLCLFAISQIFLVPFANAQTVVVYETVEVFDEAQPTTSAPTPDATPSISQTYTSPSLFQSTLLNNTNTWRASFNADALSWNESLAAYAQKAASTCHFAHTDGPYGENLAAGYASTWATVNGWGNETTDYSWKHPGFGESTGHFTQLVWQGSTDMGCGVMECDGDDGTPGVFVVCEYWPAGNVIGAFAQNVGSRVDSGYPGLSDMGDVVGGSGMEGHISGAVKARRNLRRSLWTLVAGAAVGAVPMV